MSTACRFAAQAPATARTAFASESCAAKVVYVNVVPAGMSCNRRHTEC